MSRTIYSSEPGTNKLPPLLCMYVSYHHLEIFAASLSNIIEPPACTALQAQALASNYRSHSSEDRNIRKDRVSDYRPWNLPISTVLTRSFCNRPKSHWSFLRSIISSSNNKHHACVIIRVIVKWVFVIEAVHHPSKIGDLLYHYHTSYAFLESHK
eukprot:scaffold11238_cov97-Skeletonema_menzelii.AAC.1